MTTPMQPMGSESPLDYETLMSLRNNARGQTNMGGAAQRRLSGMPQQAEGMMSEGAPPGQELMDGQTPDDMIISDMQEEEDAMIEPPDITQSAAQTMMRYGMVQEYLMRARGEIPNG